jgi:hypothetical protein
MVVKDPGEKMGKGTWFRVGFNNGTFWFTP